MRGRQLKPGQCGEVTVIRKPSGSWQASAYFCSMNGKIRRVRKSADTKALAVQRLKREVRPNGKVRVRTAEELLVEWLKRHQGISQGTRERYTKVINNHLVPRIGDVLIDDLDGMIVQDALDSIALDVSRAAAANARGRLITACKWGMRMRILTEDPSAPSVIPGRNRRKRPWAPTDAQVEALGRAIEADLHGDRSGPKDPNGFLAFEIMRGTGCRVGEVCAVTVDDFNPSGPTLTFRDTVVSQTGPVSVKGSLKNEDPFRVSYIPPRLVKALGDYAPSSGTILATRSGGRTTPANIRRSWRRVQDIAKVPKDEQLSPHDLRRWVATKIREQLDLDSAAEQLGDTREIAEKHYTMPAFMGPREASRILA